MPYGCKVKWERLRIVCPNFAWVDNSKLSILEMHIGYCWFITIIFSYFTGAWKVLIAVIRVLTEKVNWITYSTTLQLLMKVHLWKWRRAHTITRVPEITTLPTAARKLHLSCHNNVLNSALPLAHSCHCWQSNFSSISDWIRPDDSAQAIAI